MRRNFPVYFRLFSRRNNSFLQSDGRRNYGKSNKGICRSRTLRSSDDMQTIKNDNKTIDSAYMLHYSPYRCDIFLTRKANNKGIFFTKSPGFSPKSIYLPGASPENIAFPKLPILHPRVQAKSNRQKLLNTKCSAW